MVVDASVAVKWFVDEPGHAAARELIKSDDLLVAPDVVILEILSVLRRKQRLKLISERQVIGAVGEVRACFANLILASMIADQALRLSIELDHSVCDCSYLSWAMSLDVKLITADARFSRKLGHTRYARHVVDLVTPG